MIDQVKKVLRDREHASRLLSEKLLSYKNSDAVIVALPPGGVPVGNHLALLLMLPLDVMIARQIKHPAHSDRYIGAITADDVFLQDEASSIPQHYIYHQIHQIQHRIKSETDAFHRTLPKQNLKGRPVILCDTTIFQTNCLAACLQSLRNQQPSRIIVATLLATSKAAFLLTDQELEFHYLNMILHRDMNAVLEMCDEEEEVLPSLARFSKMPSIQ
jgi:putative phosphoribosyl transferase